MIRSAALVLLFVAPVLIAAPVPKELRAGPGHVGKWQNVYVDANNPAVITSRGQFWYFREDGGFTYQNEGEAAPPPQPSERMVFDPKTGHVQLSMMAADERTRFGVYRIDGDRLTMNLNTGTGPPRPKGLEPEAGSGLWHLQRIGEKK